MIPPISCSPPCATMAATAAVLSLLLSLLIPGEEAETKQVSSLLHHSVELYDSDLSLPSHDVIWKFQTQNKTATRAVMYQNNQTTIYNPQFTDRLKLSNNGTQLHIKDLRMEDTGVYTTEVTLTNNEIHHATYNLTVYEPIPQPNIITVKENAEERCNVTLHCSVPSQTSHLSYTWISRHQDSTYQLYSNGGTIQISLPPDHQDMELLCIVQNPADQKNVSIRRTSCTKTGRPRHQWVLYIIPVVIILSAVTILVIWKIRRKEKKKMRRKESKEERKVEYLMLELPQPSSSSQILPNEDISHHLNPPPQTFETLYSYLELKT
ncbi:SLAM family member 9-like [Phyllobates terribilis]|uniref:SLAM family member 9-like n=1 Tax=Phyllobates terribilis TaxID=111132 RepID=UPI003CCA70E0